MFFKENPSFLIGLYYSKINFLFHMIIIAYTIEEQKDTNNDAHIKIESRPKIKP